MCDKDIRSFKEEMTFNDFVKLSEIAKKCHEANNKLLIDNGKEPLPDWNNLDRNQRFINIKSVRRIVDKPTITPEEIHDEWVKNKRRDGWVYGEVKDDEKKTHPLLVDFNVMSKFDKEKDIIFIKTVLDNMGE